MKDWGTKGLLPVSLLSSILAVIDPRSKRTDKDLGTARYRASLNDILELGGVYFIANICQARVLMEDPIFKWYVRGAEITIKIRYDIGVGAFWFECMMGKSAIITTRFNREYPILLTKEVAILEVPCRAYYLWNPK